MKIVICGDTHGHIDYRKISQSNLKKLCGEFPQAIIIAGDFGVPWALNKKDSQDSFMTKFYALKKIPILVVPGNHENYDRINQLPVVSIFGAKSRKYSSNIYFIERNEVLTIEEKTFFCFGGATSYDKQFRIQGISWWPEESASYLDGKNMMDTLAKQSYYDYIITHTCPEEWVPDLLKNYQPGVSICSTRKVLSELAKRASYKKWFFGHFHVDRELPREKAICLYGTPYVLNLST